KVNTRSTETTFFSTLWQLQIRRHRMKCELNPRLSSVTGKNFAVIFTFPAGGVAEHSGNL
ncbi:MAG: hypothetical protein ACLRRQ_12370, partial [Lachnospira pectinoschiza]